MTKDVSSIEQKEDSDDPRRRTMGQFLRELMEIHDEEHPLEPMLTPDEIIDASFPGFDEDRPLEDLLDRTEPELAEAVPSPLLVAQSLAKSLEERPLETLNIHLTPFSLPDYYTLSTEVGSQSEGQGPSSTSTADNVDHIEKPFFSTPVTFPSRTQPKRRYQRRGAIKHRNWNPARSTSYDRSEENSRPLFDLNDKLASPPTEPIYMNRSSLGVTRKLSMRQKQAQPVMLIDDHSSYSGDEAASSHKLLKDTRSGSLPSMSIHSEEEGSQDSNTWSSTYDKDHDELGFPDTAMTSSIFRSDSTSNSINDFQVLGMAFLGSDDHSTKSVPSPLQDEGHPPHSAPPFTEDSTQFSFERRKSTIQELPAISEDQREDERAPSACSSMENENTIHRRSTSDYILDKKEASPPLVKRNSIQETKGKPRLRIITGNPNGKDESVEMVKENVMGKTYELPYSPHEDKSMMILKQTGTKKFQLVEGQKRFYKRSPNETMQKQKSQVSLTSFFGRFGGSRQNSDESLGSNGGQAGSRRSLKWKSLFGKSSDKLKRDRSNTSIGSGILSMPFSEPDPAHVVRLRRTLTDTVNNRECVVSHLSTLMEDSTCSGQHHRCPSSWNLPRSRHSFAAIEMGIPVNNSHRCRRFSVVGPEEYDKERYRICDEDNEKLNIALGKMDLSDSTVTDLNLSSRSFSVDVDLNSSTKSITSPRSVKNYLTLRKRRAASSQIPTAHRLEATSLTPRRTPIQKKKTKAKRRQSGRIISSAVDFIDPSLLHVAGNPQALLPVLAQLPDSNIRKQLSSVSLRTDRDKKPGMILTTLLSIRHKKKKDGRSTASVSPSGVELDLKRSSYADFGSAINHSRKTSEVLPDSLARVFGTQNGGLDWKAGSEGEPVRWPLWEKPKWEDLNIWEDIEGSWSSRNPSTSLSHADEKRQNVIFELFATEKRHCRVLIYLQQVFQAGLLIHNILTPIEIKAIIPDVLDSLLDFHLHFLRQIQQRIEEKTVVDTISDIVVDEFKNGENRAAAVNAYTEFCLASHDADKCYADYMNKNFNFKHFIDHIDKNPIFKKNLSFKSCFLLITQRLTKYPMLLDQIAKYETGEEKNLSLRACTAVKGFASRVDKELSTHMLHKRFDRIRNMIEKTSKGNLLGTEFTYDDLVLSGESYRKILSIGTVSWRSPSRQTFELIMLLFDDIIVFLQGRNDILYFFHHKDHASVLPLKATLVREMPRSNEVMLIVIDPKKPDMYRLTFNSKSEMTQWVHALKSANTLAPKFVRKANDLIFVEGGSRSSTSQDYTNEETKYTEDLDKWHDELDKLYEERRKGENKLEEYMEEHMTFFDHIREHIVKFPIKTVDSNGQSSVRQRELKEITKMKNLLKAHFADLRAYRRTKLDKMIQRAERSRDSDLPSYYDEVYELSHPSGFESATFSSSSDENLPSTSDRCRKPRRVRTYHGEEDSKQQGGVRRHTTVPHVYDNADENEFVRQLDQELRKLPLKVNQRSRKAITDMIRENIQLRIENDRLKDENALKSIHLTALKARKNPFAETTEKLESLRQKQEEVQNREVLFKKEYEKKMEGLKILEDELKAKEAELKQKEMELRLRNNNVSSCSLSTESPVLPASESPRPDLNRETSFRLGAAILDTQKPSTMVPRSTQSATDVVPRHLASKSETKLDKNKKRK